jgi:hypothetical protein
MRLVVRGIIGSLMLLCTDVYACDSGHWIDAVIDDGSIVKLEDGTVWEVASYDRVDSALWLPTTDIVVCDDKLINTEDNESVDAKQLR